MEALRTFLIAAYPAVIIIQLVILLGISTFLKNIGNPRQIIVFSLLFFVQSFAIYAYGVTGFKVFILLGNIIYTTIGYPYLTALNLNKKRIVYIIFFISLIEIFSFFLFGLSYSFLILSLFYLLLTVIKLFLKLSGIIENTLKSILFVFISSVGFVVFLNLFLQLSTQKDSNYFYLLLYNVLLVSISLFLYLRKIVLIMNSLFSNEPNKIDQNIEIVNPKYSKSLIVEGTANELQENISKLPISYFLNPDLNLEDMAKSLNTSKHNLSQILNSKMNASFNQYVNEIRLQYAEDLFKNQKDLDIETVAIKSGFSSIATFYRVFKSKHQISPKTFREQE